MIRKGIVEAAGDELRYVHIEVSEARLHKCSYRLRVMSVHCGKTEPQGLRDHSSSAGPGRYEWHRAAKEQDVVNAFARSSRRAVHRSVPAHGALVA